MFVQAQVRVAAVHALAGGLRSHGHALGHSVPLYASCLQATHTQHSGVLQGARLTAVAVAAVAVGDAGDADEEAVDDGAAAAGGGGVGAGVAASAVVVVVAAAPTSGMAPRGYEDADENEDVAAVAGVRALHARVHIHARHARQVAQTQTPVQQSSGGHDPPHAVPQTTPKTSTAAAAAVRRHTGPGNEPSHAVEAQ